MNATLLHVCCRQTGADGAEHTTRTVTNEGDESSEEGSDDMEDLLKTILGGGMPDAMMRSVQDIESAVEDQNKATVPAQPKVAAPEVHVAPKVSNEEAKEAVETAMNAQGLELDSAEKRQASMPLSQLAMLIRSCVLFFHKFYSEL